jgi:hypothetical protein
MVMSALCQKQTSTSRERCQSPDNVRGEERPKEDVYERHDFILRQSWTKVAEEAEQTEIRG